MNEKQSDNSSEHEVLFSSVNGQRTDEHLHEDLLQSVASVADEAGIRMLMKTGLTREQACLFVRPS